MRHPDGSPWWEALMGEMVKASMRLTQAAPDAFPLSVPHPAAEDESVAAAAGRLGQPLDGQHETLLRLADGWELAFLSGNLLGTHELGQGQLWADANASLDAFYAEGDSAGWPPRAELVPIQASPYDSDVMALWLGGPVTEGGHPFCTSRARSSIGGRISTSGGSGCSSCRKARSRTSSSSYLLWSDRDLVSARAGSRRRLR